MRLLFFLVAASCFVLFPAVAAAQCDDATAAYDEAQELLEAGEPEDALALFRCAYEAEPNPSALYGVAQCHVALGRYAPAIDILDTLARENQRFSEQMDIERLITELQEFVAEPAVPNNASSVISQCQNAHSYTSSGPTTMVTNYYQLPPAPASRTQGNSRNTTATNSYRLPPVPPVPTRRTLGNKLSWVAFSGGLALTAVGSALLIRSVMLHQEFKEKAGKNSANYDLAGMAETGQSLFVSGLAGTISGLALVCASILLLVFVPSEEPRPSEAGSRPNVHLALTGTGFIGSF